MPVIPIATSCIYRTFVDNNVNAEIEDAPPKYESVLGIAKMRKAVQKSPNKAGGAFKVFEMLTGSGIHALC